MVYAIKQLANHAVSLSDVTDGYIIRDPERIREPMQKIAQYILQQAGHSSTSDNT
jgi:hypothetical protein